MQNKNFTLFIALVFIIFAGWLQLRLYLWPPPKPAAKLNLEAEPKVAAPAPGRGEGIATKAIAGLWAELRKPAMLAAPRGPVVRIPAPAPPTPADKLLSLGDADPRSRFHIKAVFDPRGAGVRSVILNKFQEADEWGRPVWRDPVARVPAPLELVPDKANRDTASNVLYHYRSPDDDRPLDTLGKIAWKVVGDVQRDQTDDGRQRQRLAFETELPGVRIIKTFTLVEGDYHLGLEVTLARLKTDEGVRKFRYQLSGAHGLPVEGRWYTSIFRNALIGRLNALRDMQTLQEIGRWEGGKEIVKEPGKAIRYAAVAVQYFASAIVVDDLQPNQDFLRQARPTLEIAVARGPVKKIDREANTFVLTTGDHEDRTFYLANNQDLRDQFYLNVKEGSRQAVIFHSDGSGRSIATRVAEEMRIQPLWEEDITVRVATEPVELKPGEEVTHKYLLYNGPVKPSLLAGMKGDAAVSPNLLNRYAFDLSLNTMTDTPSANWLAQRFNDIGWTKLIIWFTNRMHGILGFLHMIFPSYGICIVLLTVLVRGIMFPLSRKQALVSIKMQELAPEMKKIQEKFKDDKTARGQAQMELYRKHKINPFGTCWLLLLQMPVFMGLYFALQESIQFRLAPFWPTWIVNLAAPDMMIWWGQNIPLISLPEAYGGLLYLGPYFNLLPVIAVTLMIFQQKMMTPPATNEEEAMRNSMMKYMMVFFGLMFYKVASGLCLYFVASSLWGFAERKLLPKKKAASGDADNGLAAKIAPSAAADSNRFKRRTERGRKDDGNSNLGRLRAWWADVLKQAEKK